jgi:drug/metabolite transporter (DMT)-like permease
VKKETFLVHLSALLSMFFWGMSYVWSKQVFEVLQPASTVFIRLIISSVFLFLVLKILRKTEHIQRKHIGMFLVSSLFNPFFYFMGESFGLNLASPTVSAVIIATIPVFMPVFAYMLLKEKLGFVNVIGLIVSFLGVLVMIIQRDYTLTASPKGILYLFGAVASALVYGILLKKLTLNYKPLTIVWVQNSIGIFYFLPVVLLFETESLSNAVFSFNLLSNLLLLGVFASSLAFVFFTFTVSKIGIARTNIYTNLIPVFTAFFSYFLLGEIITFDKILGITLVIIGVILSQKRKKLTFDLKTKKLYE